MSTVKLVATLFLVFTSIIVLFYTTPVSANSKAEKLWKRIASRRDDDVVDPTLVRDLEHENDEDDSLQNTIKKLLKRTKKPTKTVKRRGTLDQALVDTLDVEEEEEYNRRREQKLRRKKQKLNKLTHTTAQQISNPESSPEIDEHHDAMIDAEIMKEEASSEDSDEDKINNAKALKEALHSFAQNFHLD